jgi:hypothetical protein
MLYAMQAGSNFAMPSTQKEVLKKLGLKDDIEV